MNKKTKRVSIGLKRVRKELPPPTRIIPDKRKTKSFLEAWEKIIKENM